MPLVEFDPEEKQGSPFDYPKLKLERGERARINVIDKTPMAEFVHTLRSPVVVNGQPEMETVRRGDDEITQVKQTFVGRPICLGDYEKLKEKGLDPDACPICAAVADYGDAVQAPDRRFATHVVHYVTDPGGFAVASPFSARLKAWSFPQRILDKLIEVAQEHGPLREHDLLLGPCENAQWQKFDIQPSKDAVWIQSEQAKLYVADLYKNNQTPYLDNFIGRRRTRAEIDQDLQLVLMRHRQAYGGSAPTTDTAEVDSMLDEALSGVSSTPAGELPDTDAPAPDTILGEPVQGNGSAAVDDLLTAEPAPVAAPVAAAPEGDEPAVKSFEELLGEIDQA